MKEIKTIENSFNYSVNKPLVGLYSNKIHKSNNPINLTKKYSKRHQVELTEKT